jgi:hypothetical protein
MAAHYDIFFKSNDLKSPNQNQINLKSNCSKLYVHGCGGI